MTCQPGSTPTSITLNLKSSGRCSNVCTTGSTNSDIVKATYFVALTNTPSATTRTSDFQAKGVPPLLTEHLPRHRPTNSSKTSLAMLNRTSLDSRPPRTLLVGLEAPLETYLGDLPAGILVHHKWRTRFLPPLLLVGKRLRTMEEEIVSPQRVATRHLLVCLRVLLHLRMAV